MKYYSVGPASCGRGDGFDAEIVFKEEEFVKDRSVVTYNQRLAKSGFKTREEALAHAEEVVTKVQAVLTSHVNDYLKQFKEAKP